MRALWLSAFLFGKWCYRDEPGDACEGTVDADGDEHFVCDGQDCDDANPKVNKGASEIEGNCVDENCDGVIEALTTTDKLLAAGGGAVLCGAGTNAPEVGVALSTSGGGGPAMVVGAPGAQESGAVYLIEEDALNDTLGEVRPVGEVANLIITGESRSRLGSALARLDVIGDEDEELFIGMPGLSANSYSWRGGVVMVSTDDIQGLRELSLDTEDSTTCPTSYCLVAGGDTTSLAALGASLHAGVTGPDDVPFLLASAPSAENGAGAVALQLDEFNGGRHVMDAGLMVSGAAGGDRLGSAIGSSDLNCDGDQEALLGANGYSIDSTLVSPGAVYSVPIRSGVWADSTFAIDDYLLTFRNDNRAHLGSALATGDLDGDGCGDLVVATSYGPKESSTETITDQVYVIFGAEQEFSFAEIMDLAESKIAVTWTSPLVGATDRPLALSIDQAGSDPADVLLIGLPSFNGDTGAFWAGELTDRTLTLDLSNEGDPPNREGEAPNDQLGSALARTWWEDQVGVAAGAPGWADRSGAVFWFTGATTFGEP